MAESTKRPVGFFDLSAELRNSIYELLLLHPNTIYLYWSRVGSITKRRIQIEHDEIDKYLRGEGPPGYKLRCNEPIRGYSLHKFTIGEDTKIAALDARKLWSGNNATLLQACRQLYSEAAPILYGGNSFACWGHVMLKYFLERIGCCSTYIRQLRVETAILPSLTMLVEIFDVTVNLQRLEFGPALRVRFKNPIEWAVHLLPLFRRLKDQNQLRADGKQIDVLNILDFPPIDQGSASAIIIDGAKARAFSVEVKIALQQVMSRETSKRRRRRVRPSEKGPARNES